MGLIGNGRYYSPRTGILPGAVSAIGSCPAYRPSWSAVSLRMTFDNDYASFPVGYYQNGIVLPMKYGGIACTIRCGGSLAASIAATASIGTTLSGAGSLSVYGYKGLNGAVSVFGSCSFTPGIAARANISCTVTIGAQPSAFDIAQAIWNATATQYNVAGSMGQKLNAAGGSADPLTNDVPGSYAPGTAGEAIGKIKNNLTLTQFLALK